MQFLAALYNNKIARFIINYFVKKLWNLLTHRIVKYYKKKQQEKTDKKNLEEYKKVEEGKLSNEEEIKITEDLLNGK